MSGFLSYLYLAGSPRAEQGLFKAGTMIDQNQLGGIVEYTATHPLGPWTRQPDPFLETDGGCCPHHFEWNGWHYIMMGNRVWLSENLLGPYGEHKPERLMCVHFPMLKAEGNG